VEGLMTRSKKRSSVVKVSRPVLKVRFVTQSATGRLPGTTTTSRRLRLTSEQKAQFRALQRQIDSALAAKD
jgi:hypothetical protein